MPRTDGRDLAYERWADAEQVRRLNAALGIDPWLADDGTGPRCAYLGCTQPANPDADDLCGWHFKDRHRDPAWDAERQRLASPEVATEDA